MKKNSSCSQSPKRGKKAQQGRMTIGMDLGDKTSRYCVLNEQGEVPKSPVRSALPPDSEPRV